MRLSYIAHYSYPTLPQTMSRHVRPLVPPRHPLRIGTTITNKQCTPILVAKQSGPVLVAEQVQGQTTRSIQNRQLHSMRSPLAMQLSPFRSMRSRTLQRRQYGTSFLASGGAGSGVMAVYWVWLGINVVPFGIWNYAQYTHNYRIMEWWARNMTCSVASSSRPWTYLTSAVSHQSLTHFAFNMLTARTFCQILSFMPGMGAGHAAAAILLSSLSSSLGYRFVQLWKSKQALARGDTREATRAINTPAIGASGGVMGLGALATCFAPYTPLNIMFIPIAIPLWGVTAAYAAIDAYGTGSTTSRTAHAGHLGGLVAGFAYYFMLF